ncbi:CoF synthetase [Hymenobacter busanensis]|uniref:CoF synthetase n=1 Tax=Hymenobacter busanensis TaxID=2607656 RepID=A0A7L4ZWC3_9BACT|nr:CoF synthetase [Hymenobacter busanensis]KAA9339093.1 CoF synthetase [Hymenobacter busanensis]QHJ07145.1 CoF synthetase [Hymenobacter busanensis]
MKSAAIFALVQFLQLWRKLLELSDPTMQLLFLPGMEATRWNIGRLKAWTVYRRARRTAPAYRTFLDAHPAAPARFHGLVPDLSTLPVMDKDNYVKPYSIAERCFGGRVPAEGVIVDESSGSSGQATHWVRSRAERQANKRMLEFGLRQLLGPGPCFVINAFAMGPWATGVNVTMAFTDVSMLKSTGPDVPKIEHTLQFFGPAHRYVIMGYPPFLKLLADTADLDWAQYDVTLIYGGEGMSELMRDYLLRKGIRRVYGSLGASDLELNLAAETDFSIALRKALMTNPQLAAKLLKYPGALPVAFQFNPADFVIEESAAGELLVTLCRPTYLAPKIRYNIHDRGQVIRYPELKRILAECGLRPEDLCLKHTDLPLLLHYGRADMTVAYFGCKIALPDVQEALMRTPGLAERVHSFTLFTAEDTQANKQLRVCFELLAAQRFVALDKAALSAAFFAELQAVNQDFRESWRMIPVENRPQVEFYPYHTGPFKDSDLRIKLRYIQAA